MTTTERELDWGKCAFGDHPAERGWNGMSVCWKDWNRQKLDLPAARHWLDMVEKFRANVDTYDLMTFWPKHCGLDEEDIHNLSVILDKLEQGSREVIGE